LTLYASGSFGNGYTQALGGLRYYFGDPGKSLIRRHREDDPVTEGGNSLPGDLFDSNECPAGTVYTNDGGGMCVTPYS
jgi:hypothetical protein